MTAIQWVVFDLGGVLVEVKPQNIFEKLSHYSGLPTSQVAQALNQHTPWREDFGVREFSRAEVTDEINRALGTRLLENQVIEAINAELGPQIAGTETVVASLKPHVQLACLSNTNSVHWDELYRAYTFMQQLDTALASQSLGCAKPGHEIYRKATTILGAAPHELLFFDDKVENVRAAQELGWNARVCSGTESIIAGLREFRLPV